MMHPRWILALPVFLLCMGVLGNARAQLIVDLSNHLVAITTGFTGTEVLLFGTTEGKGDVIVVVRGPESEVVVRRKGRKLGIWVNDADMVFQGVPGYYAIATNRPLEEFLPKRVAARHQIGVDNLRFSAPQDADPAKAETFREALIRNKVGQDLYFADSQHIAFLGNRLFRTDMRFPANAPVGTYIVQIFLVEDGEVVGAEITPLVVSKVGFEAGVFHFAHRHSLAYGVLAILIAVVAGWAASAVFRKG